MAVEVPDIGKLEVKLFLFSRYASRIRRLMRFRCTALLKFFLGTEKSTCTGAEVSVWLGSTIIRKGKANKAFPSVKSLSMVFLLLKRSFFENLN